MISHYRLPRMIQRGVSSTLTLDVYAADGTTQQTASAGTVSVYAGSRAIVQDAAVFVGPPASYSLAGSATASESLSEDWLEVWTLTIGGTAYTFQRPAYLVRRELYPTLIDADLVEYHSDLLSLLDPDDTNLQRYRDLAWDAIQTALIRQGRRPQLVLDAWQLRALHAYRCLELFFRDAASSVGDGRYIQLAREYGDLAAAEWAALSFRYDADQDGYVDSQIDGTTAGVGVLYLAAPKAVI